MTAPFRKLKFSRAAESYHEASSLQRDIAARLIQMVPEKAEYPTILELGCGTGHLSHFLLRRFPRSAVILTDISDEMLEECQKTLTIGNFSGGIRWAMQDAEMPLAFEEQSMICSNALVQWVADLPRHLRHIHQKLAKNGTVYLSGFCSSNFPELRSVLGGAPFNVTRFPGYAAERVKRALAEAGFVNVVISEERRQMLYPSVEMFLKRLKEIGAGGRPDILMTRGRLKLLSETYRKYYAVGASIPATWKYWLCRAEKHR